MKFGLHSVNLHGCAYPDAAARLGRAAEAAGFESLWVADHVVLPDPPVAERPMAPDMRLIDPIVALTFLAAHTTRILLATGVIILPQRQALVLAKQLPRSTCCPTAGSSSGSASAGASPRCDLSASRSPSAAGSPTTTWPPCARCGRSRSPPTGAATSPSRASRRCPGPSRRRHRRSSSADARRRLSAAR